MNIEVITDDYGSMGRVIGSELHIIVESQRIENPYTDKSNGKELEERLIKRAEKLKAKIERALRTKELLVKRMEELIEGATTGCVKVKELQKRCYCDCECCCLFDEFQSILDEANSYIMKETNES